MIIRKTKRPDPLTVLADEDKDEDLKPDPTDAQPTFNTAGSLRKRGAALFTKRSAIPGLDKPGGNLSAASGIPGGAKPGGIGGGAKPGIGMTGGPGLGGPMNQGPRIGGGQMRTQPMAPPQPPMQSAIQQAPQPQQPQVAQPTAPAAPPQPQQPAQPQQPQQPSQAQSGYAGEEQPSWNQAIPNLVQGAKDLGGQIGGSFEQMGQNAQAGMDKVMGGARGLMGGMGDAVDNSPQDSDLDFSRLPENMPQDSDLVLPNEAPQGGGLAAAPAPAADAQPAQPGPQPTDANPRGPGFQAAVDEMGGGQEFPGPQPTDANPRGEGFQAAVDEMGGQMGGQQPAGELASTDPQFADDYGSEQGPQQPSVSDQVDPAGEMETAKYENPYASSPLHKQLGHWDAIAKGQVGGQTAGGQEITPEMQERARGQVQNYLGQEAEGNRLAGKGRADAAAGREVSPTLQNYMDRSDEFTSGRDPNAFNSGRSDASTGLLQDDMARRRDELA